MNTKKYNIFSEENQFGEIKINNGKLEINIFPNMIIDVSKLYKSKVYKIDKVKSLKKIKNKTKYFLALYPPR